MLVLNVVNEKVHDDNDCEHSEMIASAKQKSLTSVESDSKEKRGK